MDVLFRKALLVTSPESVGTLHAATIFAAIDVINKTMSRETAMTLVRNLAKFGWELYNADGAMSLIRLYIGNELSLSSVVDEHDWDIHSRLALAWCMFKSDANLVPDGANIVSGIIKMSVLPRRQLCDAKTLFLRIVEVGSVGFIADPVGGRRLFPAIIGIVVSCTNLRHEEIANVEGTLRTMCDRILQHTKLTKMSCDPRHDKLWELVLSNHGARVPALRWVRMACCQKKEDLDTVNVLHSVVGIWQCAIRSSDLQTCNAAKLVQTLVAEHESSLGESVCAQHYLECAFPSLPLAPLLVLASCPWLPVEFRNAAIDCVSKTEHSVEDMMSVCMDCGISKMVQFPALWRTKKLRLQPYFLILMRCINVDVATEIESGWAWHWRWGPHPPPKSDFLLRDVEEEEDDADADYMLLSSPTPPPPPRRRRHLEQQGGAALSSLTDFPLFYLSDECED